MVEENTSEPPPPDIRPYGRITQQDAHCASRIAVDHLGVQDQVPHPSLPATRRSGRTLSKFLNGHAQSLLCLLFIAAIFLPTASARDDAFTSPPMHTRTHSTPILSFLRSAFAYAQSAIDHVFNNDVAPRGGAAAGYSHLAKRKDISGGEIAEICVIPLLVLLSGTFAGLTLGYFSVDPTQLQVLSISGTPKQQEYARRIMPVRKDSHLLLTTLILGNMIVNEALPVVFDNVVSSGIIATVASTALVVVFAEIIPQSICSRYGLLVGATMAWPVRVLIWIAFPIAWPIAKLLEYILGAHHGIIYRRSELRELIKIHAAGGEGGGDLDLDTVTMAQGALDLAQKTVKEAMTPIDRVFMLPIEAKLDYETLGHVVRSGHSRIPVYQMVEVPDINLAAPTLGPAKTKLVKKVIGSLLVKSCVLLDPEDATPLASIPINAIPSVPWDEPLTNMLNVFQEGRSHMAIVSRRGKRVEKDVEDAESVMTAAAGGLKQKFMRKVAEISHHHGKGSTTSGSEGGITSGSDTEGEDVEKAEKKKKKRARSKSHSSPTKEKPSEAAKVKEEVEAEKKKRSIAQAAKLNQLEQSVPADAQLPPESVDKFFEGLEGAPLGIITLEDVLEELIGEEIYDEYDEHGGPRNAASAFIPREAALAARQAALNREKAAAAAAAATPLPPNADAGLETSNTAPAPNRRVAMPKLPTMPRFGLSKRPTSQPGRSRVPIADLTPVNPAPVLTQTDKFTAEPVEHTDSPHRSASGADFTGTTIADPGSEIAGTKPPSRAASGNALDALNDAAVDMSSAQPIASAVPARMLAVPGTGSTSSVPAATTTNATLLSEALLMERSRRRMVAQAGGTGTSTPPLGGVPSMIRAASATGTPRVSSTGTGMVPPQPSQGGRVPTPPSGGPAAKTMPPPATSATPAGILSPQPRRAPKFKSVPTPVAGTPVPGEKPDSNLELTKADSKAKESEE